MTFQERKSQAQKLIVEDDYLKAFDEFSKLHYDFPDDKDIMNTCLFLFDRIVEANYDFEPETAEQYIFRGVSKYYKQDLAASVIDFDKALSINPKLDYAIKCKAFSLMYMGQYEFAIKCLESAIELNPSGEYFDDIAENYSRMGRVAEALYFHEKAIQHSPKNERLWYNYGTHLGKNGEFERAIEMFDEALRLYPEYKDAKHNRQHYIRRLNNKAN